MIAKVHATIRACVGQFKARYSTKCLPAIRIAIQSTAIVGRAATIRAAPYQRPADHQRMRIPPEITASYPT